MIGYYGEGLDASNAIVCAHCGGTYTHPTTAQWLNPSISPIEVKDTVWSVPAARLGCEGCAGVTEVHLMFHKGNTFVHTIALRTRP